jgi:hypothetical protein
MAEHDSRNNPLDRLQHSLKGQSGNARRLAENLEDNPICAVSYDANVPCLFVQWRGYAKSTEIRYVHECILRLVEEHRVSKLLGDDAALRTITAVDQHWIVDDWMPRAIAAGLKTAASNRPSRPSGRASVNRIRSAVPAGLAIRSFGSLDEAKAWLRSVYQAGRYRIHYRRFKRGGEPLSTFAFWFDESSVGHFRQLARVALRSFWKIEAGSLEPVISRQPLPELIVITTERGEEVCRWSLQNEWSLLAKHSDDDA